MAGAEVARFADIQVLRYYVDGFESLPLADKLLVYRLSLATTAGRDIYTDENSRFALGLRTLLEAIYLHYRGDRSTSDFRAFDDYLMRYWFSSGPYHHYGEYKHKARFSEQFFREAIDSIANYLPPFEVFQKDEYCRLLFDENYQPIRTAASDTVGDLLESSAVNFYQDVSREEAEAYYAEKRAAVDAPKEPGLNSRLLKDERGEIVEEVASSTGLYAKHIQRIVQELRAAETYVTIKEQRESLRLLISYYESGELADFDKYSIAWLRDLDGAVDFINGFIETYQDPLGIKGSWEGIVELRDKEASRRTQLLSERAAWFEANAPIDDDYRKKEVKGVSAAVVNAAMLGGDAYPATPIGINLPNADDIRATHGSKSVSIENIQFAYNQASKHSGMDEAFIKDEEVRALLEKYGDVTDRVHTDLHECLGHGSGILRPDVPADALGSWHATIEETRADLFALYFLADDEILRLGLLPDKEAYKAAYYRYMHNGLIGQLVRIELGRNIEEAHMRNRALISRYVLEKGAPLGAVSLSNTDLKIHDYESLRDIIGQLLREVQRIKSEGDTDAAALLIKRYAIDVPRELHEEVLARYRSLNLAPYRGFVNPRYHIVYNADNEARDVEVDYTEGYAEQMLRYSRETALERRETMRIELKAPSFESLSLADQAAANKLRSMLRQRMDGVIAEDMRKAGIDYKYNFGVSRNHLDELAKLVPPSAQLARYLFERPVRELRLLALRLFPHEELTAQEALYMAREAEGSLDLTNELPALLFDRCKQASQWALGWIVAQERVLTIAYITLARALTRGLFIPTAQEKVYLIMTAVDHLTTEGAASLCLKRLGTQDKAAAEAILAALSARYGEDERPETQEIVHGIRFELEAT